MELYILVRTLVFTITQPHPLTNSRSPPIWVHCREGDGREEIVMHTLYAHFGKCRLDNSIKLMVTIKERVGCRFLFNIIAACTLEKGRSSVYWVYSKYTDVWYSDSKYWNIYFTKDDFLCQNQMPNFEIAYSFWRESRL